jgi:hypothetical protein
VVSFTFNKNGPPEWLPACRIENVHICKEDFLFGMRAAYAVFLGLKTWVEAECLDGFDISRRAIIFGDDGIHAGGP